MSTGRHLVHINYLVVYYLDFVCPFSSSITVVLVVALLLRPL